MAIRLDFTSESVVVICDSCPQWRALRGSRVTAWAAARDHEKESHEGQRQASLAYGMARRKELQQHVAAQAGNLDRYMQGTETT